ncbi:MAG TPA: hypothetical protein VN175_06920 [Rhizomicrobium sp.]|nr:hypothetical protein [Rhizomicrobium sp.]
MTEFLLFAHILLFVFSFAFTAGVSIVGNRIAGTRDAKAIHAYFSAIRPLSLTGGIGWILTAATGGALAHAYGLDMTAPWLVCSYAAFAVLILTGFLLHAPWQAKVVVASATPGPALDAVLHSPVHRIASIVSALSILTLLYLMTAKPG